MGITISNNGAVQRASYHLSKAQDNFQKSIRRLASGKRIVGASEDPGTLAVAMKVQASINQLTGAQNNVRSGIGFLEMQDGLLDTAGRILMRMSELKGYSTQDPLKSDADTASYNNEFKDLQKQLYDISRMSINGQALFARYRMSDDGTTEVAGEDGEEAIFGAENQNKTVDNTIDIFTSSEGSDGSKVSIHRSAFLSALVVSNDGTKIAKDYYNNGDKPEPWKDLNSEADPLTYAGADYITLAKDGDAGLLDLEEVNAEALEKAIENIVFLRAQTGGGMSRLQFAMDSIATQETNMRSALGRIEDVDMATESANLAKYGILMQASAAMVTQANLNNEVALSLIRGV
jgi:flagellin